MLVQIKSHPRIGEAGMILCHNGINNTIDNDAMNIIWSKKIVKNKESKYTKKYVFHKLDHQFVG